MSFWAFRLIFLENLANDETTSIKIRLLRTWLALMVAKTWAEDQLSRIQESYHVLFAVDLRMSMLCDGILKTFVSIVSVEFCNEFVLRNDIRQATSASIAARANVCL